MMDFEKVTKALAVAASMGKSDPRRMVTRAVERGIRRLMAGGVDEDAALEILREVVRVPEPDVVSDGDGRDGADRWIVEADVVLGDGLVETRRFVVDGDDTFSEVGMRLESRDGGYRVSPAWSLA